MQGTVVFLPGIIGSNLDATDAAGTRPVWRLPGSFDFTALMLNAGGGENDPARTIRATGPTFLSDVLIRHLSIDWNVIPVPYDWRRSTQESAATLAAAIPDEPFHIVAYSLGGLVAQQWIAQNCDRWRDMQSSGAGGRLVLLASPTYGSWVAALLLRLIGDEAAAAAHAERLFGKLGIDTNDVVLAALRTWPSFYELLPSPSADPRAVALYQSTDPAFRAYLDSARAFHAEVDTWKTDDETYYIAGWAQLTPNGPSLLNVTFNGDGVVPHVLGVPRGLRHGWRTLGHHLALPFEPIVTAAVSEILTSGTAHLRPL